MITNPKQILKSREANNRIRIISARKATKNESKYYGG